MEEKMRKTGIDLIGDTPWGTHLCLFYQSEQDLLDILLPYFKAGLENNELCVWVTSELLDEKDVRKAIKKTVPDFDAYLRRGQMEIISPAEWYLKSGTFNLQEVLNAWIDKHNKALLKGFDGLRVAGNTSWLEKGDWRDFCCGEAVDKTIGQYQIMALCVYPLDKCKASDIIYAIGNHRAVLVRQSGTWEIIESSERGETRKVLQKKTNDIIERIKELNCLYSISKLIDKQGISLEKILQGIVDLIPPAWQHPEITGAQINLEHQTFKTKNYKETIWKQSAAIIEKDNRIGTLNVCYLEERPKCEKRPFLKEEKNLINAIAKRLGKIIERKRIERALEESIEELKNIFHSSPDAITVSDLKGTIIECNLATVHMHGFSAKKELIGKSVFDLIAQKDQQKALENMKKTLKKHSIRNVEYTFVTKDDREFMVELSASLVRNSSGKPAYFVAVTKDISERKKIENKLQESERYWRLLAESMSDVIWTADLQLNLNYISPSVTRLLGYLPEEVMTQGSEETLGLNAFRAVMKLIEEKKLREELGIAREYSNSQTVEFELKRKDGSTVWVETGLTFLYDAYGQSLEVMGVMRDSSARKKAEERIEEYANKLKKRNEQFREEVRKTKKAEEKIRRYAKELRMLNLRLKAETERAQKADRLKSEFLANMSHEIRTPLTVIDGAVHLLQKNSLLPEQRELLAMIRGSGEQLMEIINATLDLARIEAGQAKVVKKEFLLKETVKNIISGFEFEAREKKLDIKMICPRHLPSMISTDEGKFTQILSNLISNALRFTEKGKVEVRLNKESNSSIRFSVEDTGIGIPEESLSLMFNKFYQIDGTARRQHGGVGLGLTIVKELVDLLGGEIKIKSNLAKGSIFYFSLPCIPSKERLVPDRDGNGTPPKTRERVKKGVNILVAEDDSPTYNIIRRFLEDCTISRAVDGEDVLKMIKEKSYDMILMDIQMPKMDGLEATRRIRERDSDLPIIAVTARSFKTDKDKCLAAGCNDYIAKPIAPQELIAKINKYVGLKKNMGKES